MRRTLGMVVLGTFWMSGLAAAQTAATLEGAGIGEVEFGARVASVTGDAARYQRFRDLRDGATLDRLRHEHRLAIAAYLEGIEPHEAGLRTQMPELLPRIEGAFMALGVYALILGFRAESQR